MKVPRRTSILPILFMLFLLLFPRVTRSGQQEAQIMSLHVTTSAFPSEGTIPKKFTCDGSDVSPPLAWRGAPPGTQSFALILDDPDAPVGTWVHWVLYDLPANTKELVEGVAKQEQLSTGARRGLTEPLPACRANNPQQSGAEQQEGRGFGGGGYRPTSWILGVGSEGDDGDYRSDAERRRGVGYAACGRVVCLEDEGWGREAYGPGAGDSARGGVGVD